MPHLIPVSLKKHSFGEESPRENRLSEHQIRGWRAVSAAELHGKASPKRNVSFTDTGTTTTTTNNYYYH